jgi:hypothetical protein
MDNGPCDFVSDEGAVLIYQHAYIHKQISIGFKGTLRAVRQIDFDYDSMIRSVHSHSSAVPWFY